VKAHALVALGELDAAAALLQAAQLTARRDGALPRLHTLHVALAAVHRLQGHADLADAEAATAGAIAETLVITIPDGELRQGFRRATGLAGDDSALTGVRDDVAAGGLTPREREVAAHIAAGRTNREIAAELYVSERTVETHVANVLRKLGLSSRVGIAIWATQHDLAPRHVGTALP